ncbi:MAG: helix-turn-helix transcriptional regulator [Bacteroidales bacterium]|nr:helix-turn-helix transcriptional regulator [Bacteroidales bacterium]
MRQKTLQYLEANQSATPSKWREEAQWRKENQEWLRYSRRISLVLLSYMKREHLTQAIVAERIGCTQQYVSRILKGTENLTIESIAKIERITGFKLLTFDANKQ